jgi:hypothetical protein
MKLPLRIVIAIVVMAVGILPAAALAHPGHGHSQSAPGHNKNSSSTSTSTSSSSNPSPRSQAEKQCRQERSTDGKATFDKTYGTNSNGKNAFGKCVSHRTRQNQQAQQSAHNSAVQTCRSEQSSDPAAFRTKYGTNHNGRNAFGKCVSSHERSSSQKTESSEVKAE